MNTVDHIAVALSGILDIWKEYLTTGDKRRMSKCIRIGDKLVERCKELKIDDKALYKLMRKWEKYNN